MSEMAWLVLLDFHTEPLILIFIRLLAVYVLFVLGLKLWNSGINRSFLLSISTPIG